MMIDFLAQRVFMDRMDIEAVPPALREQVESRVKDMQQPQDKP